MNRFGDVVFALLFFRAIEYLPSFQDGRWTQLPHGLLSLLASQPANLTRVIFGLLIIVYYWGRKNAVIVLIERSNAMFATLMIASLAFICLFIWALYADPTYIGGPPTLLLQSLSLAVAGILGFIALRYAIHANLTQPELKASAEQFTRADLSNPLTAVIAAALSWSGLTIWTLSWFVFMPLLGRLLSRGRPVAPTATRCFLIWFFVGLVALVARPASAQTIALPSPPTATPAPSTAAPPAIPANFDPCGGPLELPNKLGNGTACVFVLGEVAADASYTTITAPVSTVITGPFMRSVTALGSISADSYPGSTIYAGVGPRSQISFAPPTYVSVNTRGGVTAGGTDMTFAYKHLFLLNMEKFTMLAINAAYTAPTAGAPFGAVGPKYSLDPILTQPLPQNLGVTIAGPIANFSTSSTVCPTGIRSCHGVIGARGWSWTPQLAPYWLSPGGTMVAGFVQHSFNPSTWPAAVFVSQLLNRHVEVYAQYGGGSVSINTTGPVLGLFKASTYVTPTVFSAGVAILAGESNLPPALLQMMAPPPPASPQPQSTP